MCVAEHVSQVCIDNSSFSQVTTYCHILKKRVDYHLKMSEHLGRLSKLGGLLQPRELSNDYL